MPSTLHIIATPIGNRGDITLRAVEQLRSLEILFAEDTRELRKLLDMLGIAVEGKTLASLSLHNMKTAVSSAIEYLESGKEVGFVSDRGTPGISDPGSLLVEAAIRAGHEVRPLPGPSALTALISASYLVKKEFVFIGFVPESESERTTCFEKLKFCNFPFVFYESPKRIQKTLKAVQETFPDAEIHVARELTKMFEAHEFLAPGQSYAGEVQGEFAVLVRPNTQIAQAAKETWQQALEDRLLGDKEWAKAVAERSGASARELYNQLMANRRLPTR